MKILKCSNCNNELDYVLETEKSVNTYYWKLRDGLENTENIGLQSMNQLETTFECVYCGHQEDNPDNFVTGEQ